MRLVVGISQAEGDVLSVLLLCMILLLLYVIDTTINTVH